MKTSTNARTKWTRIDGKTILICRPSPGINLKPTLMRGRYKPENT